MQSVLNQMLSKYRVNTMDERKNAIKEIVQEIVLCGLSRGGFFNEAAFYGETALRIFYGLDRFSEDLYFSLMTQNPDFDLSKYFSYIKNETQSLGLTVEVVEKKKSPEDPIKSAFVKGNTQEHILSFFESNDRGNFMHRDEVTRIKFEVDTNPASGATFETKLGLLPSPYQVRLYDLPSLFAGKIHACLCRNWKSRIKGRDFYDYVFFLSLGAKVNLNNLKARLVQSGAIEELFDLNLDSLKLLLNQRFESVDYAQAKEDVFPFVRDKSKLDLWSKEFFIEITKKLEAL